MKYTRHELSSLKNGVVNFDEDLSFSAEAFNLPSRLRELKDVNVHGYGRYDQDQQLFTVEAEIEGTMIVPCAITLEDVVYPFDISIYEIYTFDPESGLDDSIQMAEDDEVDLDPLFFEEIFLEIPMKVIKEDLKEYPKGDGWEVMTEEAYDQQEKPLDPRLAKFKEFTEE